MADTATIGALRVVLSMDAGVFEKGADKAGKRLSHMEQTAAKAARVIGAAFVASAAAMAYAAKQALDTADEMGKMAARVGINVETLSGLAHASELAGVNLQGLDGALDRFNRTVVESARAGSDAARAFDSMGISVRNRTTEAVLLDVANKFAGYADGANKSALAMQLFGRAGADLIPLLNQGRDGIQAAADEARKFGIIISAESAKKAEDFNDAITRLQAAARGAATEIGLLAAGPLTALLLKMTDVMVAARKIPSTFAEAFGPTNAELVGARQQIMLVERELGKLLLQIYEPGNSQSVIDRLEERAGRAAVKLDELKARLADLTQASIGPFQTTTTPALPDAPDQEAQRIRAINELSEAQRLANESLANFEIRAAAASQVLQDTLTPMDEYKSKLHELAQAEVAGGVSAERMAQAHAKAANNMMQSYGAVVSNVTGALRNLFDGNKAFAVADAAVKAYLAYNMALVSPPGPPWSYANAAAALANGLAQVRAINSTTFGGGAGGGGGSAASAPAAASAEGGGLNNTLLVQGIGAGQIFTGDTMRDLLEKIVEAQRDGFRVVMSPT